MNVLISKSPPAVNADAHDHGERRPNTSDATRVHTPIASSASTTGDPRPPDGSSEASNARAHRRKCEPTSSARDRNRRRQSRTVSPGTPRRSPARRYPSRPTDSNASPITSTTERRCETGATMSYGDLCTSSAQCNGLLCEVTFSCQ